MLPIFHHISAVPLVHALKRVATIRAVGMRAVDVSAISPARLDALARYAVLSSASTIMRMPPDRRIATPFAFARATETMAHDDACDMLDALISELIRKA